jgi:hypothetical protein
VEKGLHEVVIDYPIDLTPIRQDQRTVLSTPMFSPLSLVLFHFVWLAAFLESSFSFLLGGTSLVLEMFGAGPVDRYKLRKERLGLTHARPVTHLGR